MGIQWPQRICHVCVCLRIFRVCVAFTHMLTNTQKISLAFIRHTHTRVWKCDKYAAATVVKQTFITDLCEINQCRYIKPGFP